MAVFNQEIHNRAFARFVYNYWMESNQGKLPLRGGEESLRRIPLKVGHILPRNCVLGEKCHFDG